jgi:Na+/H+-dicarboxylate symporter
VSLTVRVLIGLVAGLGFGILIALTQSPTLASIGAFIEPAGTIFINAIRMTVIPLVVASLIVGVASAPDPRSVGRIGSRALVVFLVALAAAAVFSGILAPPLLGFLDISPAASAAMRQSADASATSIETSVAQLPTIAEWIVSLVPANPIRAAADGAMLPLIVFSILFGLAVTRIEPARRAALVRGTQAIAEASLVLVRWILAFAPVGVFALAVPLATRLGVQAAGAIAYFIALVSGMIVLFIALLYVAVVIFGRVSLRDFAQATAPAQAVAFSSRSSLAALPAMIEGATTRLRLSTEITGFFLPLAASVFRIGSVIGMMVGVLFIARLYGQSVDAAQLLTIAVTSLLLTFSVPGVPGGTILIMVPVLIAAGLPVQGVGILLGVDTIPDMFRTTLNVTGHMAGATIIGRGALAPRVAVAGTPLPGAPPVS